MSRSKRLTDAQRMEIVREAANGMSTSVLAARFGVTPRAVQYTVKSDAERQRDTAVPVLAVSVKVTPEEMAEFDAVLFRIRRLEGVAQSETNLLLSTRKAG